MSSSNYAQKTCGTPSYIQKIRLDNHVCKIRKRKPTKVCPDCKETNDSVELFSSKVNKLEQVIDNFYKNLTKKNQFSTFNAKFHLNNVPCELEYDLSKFSLESLHKLMIFTTKHCNNDNKYPSSIPSNKIIENEKFIKAKSTLD
ncbi:hypothetical protein RclHR1_09150004 [Rhizophagus clarus]|uniref:Uncharacterized protein n=1 Tax=Rhizophagus clarus TaxID=94130 RepID=A0A2Z6S9J0_9GLOM|nr:hypothetical protein RclHR1_09150004 [Rhizophagus clarus]GES86386.1 hypothetical protein GLOIN_2v1580691 [Rhizophagus clarus]